MTHVYIDGESHFIRSEEAIRGLFGESVTIELLQRCINEHAQTEKQTYFPGITLDRRGKFFIDNSVFRTAVPGVALLPTVKQRVYFTSCVGDEDTLHEVRVSIRSAKFEPQVIKEQGQLAKQRGNTLANDRVIEKPKGVDIALTVRVLEDAQRNVFDDCALFTSDVDYIPLIEAVKRMGKKVSVCGYRNGIGTNSPMDFTPDKFYDLTLEMGKNRSWAREILEQWTAKRG